MKPTERQLLIFSPAGHDPKETFTPNSPNVCYAAHSSNDVPSV